MSERRDGEPRFPPPGAEVGYREAAAPVDAATPADDPDSRRHVVGVRPDDPDDALRKASLSESMVRRQNEKVAARLAQQRRASVIAILLVAVYVVIAMFWDCFGRPRRGRY